MMLMSSPLSSFVGQVLTWVPTATFKDRYDLIAADGTRLATLDMSNWTSKADAHVPEGILFMHKEGWSGLKVTVSTVGQGPLIATFKRKWTGATGQLLFPDGREFKWAKLNFWGTQKGWTEPTGGPPYIQFSSGSFTRKLRAEIQPHATEIPELSLL